MPSGRRLQHPILSPLSAAPPLPGSWCLPRVPEPPPRSPSRPRIPEPPASPKRPHVPEPPARPRATRASPSHPRVHARLGGSAAAAAGGRLLPPLGRPSPSRTQPFPILPSHPAPKPSPGISGLVGAWLKEVCDHWAWEVVDIPPSDFLWMKCSPFGSLPLCTQEGRGDECCQHPPRLGFWEAMCPHSFPARRSGKATQLPQAKTLAPRYTG